LNRLLENEMARLLRMNKIELGIVKRFVWNVLKPLHRVVFGRLEIAPT